MNLRNPTPRGKYPLSSIGMLFAFTVALVSSGQTVSSAQILAIGESTSAQSLPSAPSRVPNGVIHGFIRRGTTPLSAVSVTVTDMSTGERRTVATDATGAFSLVLPWNKSYVIRAELAAYIPATREVLLNDIRYAQQIDLSLEQRSSIARQGQPEERLDQPGKTQGSPSSGTASEVFGGSGSDGDSNLHFQLLPGDLNYSGEFFFVVGQPTTIDFFAQMNDQMRLDFEAGHELRRLLRLPLQNGGSIVSALETVRLPGGGSTNNVSVGGRGLARERPHGAIFWTGGNSALNAQPYVLAGQPSPDPSYYSNGYGLAFAGEPFIPGLIKPSRKDFILLDFSGQLGTSLVNEYGVVPTDLERQGNFSKLVGPTGALIPIYPPDSSIGGAPYLDNTINTPLNPVAKELLKYLPEPNLQSSPLNYRQLTTQGTHVNTLAINFIHSFGALTGIQSAIEQQTFHKAQGPNQSVYLSFNLNHAATDVINLFPNLGGAQLTQGYSLTVGHVIERENLTNNISFTSSRNDSRLTNYFTNTYDVATHVGVLGPSKTALNPNPANYGLPNLVFSGFNGLSQTQPNFQLTQTSAISESASWLRGRHNLRFGGDIRRVEYNVFGGVNATGTFIFTGEDTQEPGTFGNASPVVATGSSFADFLLGWTSESTIESPYQKAYMRQNVWDAFVRDYWRVLPNLTLVAGLRYDYFSPYAEKSDRLATLDYNSTFTEVGPVLANGIGPVTGAKYPRTLISPEHNNVSPPHRIGVAAAQ